MKKQQTLAQADACIIAVSASGQLSDQSESAAMLAALWENNHPELIQLYKVVQASGLPQEARIAVENGPHFWLVALPERGRVLLAAHDTTIPDQMLEALMESRKLLKSLLDVAADFSFEVDSEQVFRFVSPKDAFGVEAESWVGRCASDIFWPQGNRPARNPFTSDQSRTFDPIEIEVGGEKRTLMFSVIPVWADDGSLKGVRGSCQDVTERVLKLRQTRLDNLRLSVQERITRLLNATENAQDLLENASQELLEVLRADLVWSMMKYQDRLVPAALCGDHLLMLDFEHIWSRIKGDSKPVHEIADENRVHLVISLTLGDHSIGMVIISRDTMVSPWSQQEIQLLEAVSDILTAAFSKAQLIERLSRLSGKDELTDILNRRAMTEVVERRLQLQTRTGKDGCLLFVDLDNFKEVNDTLGHAAGDEAIKLVARALEGLIRTSDVAGRYGGDEFVVWLEGASPAIAEHKAQQLLDYMPEVRKKLGKPDLKLAASVGICQSVSGVDTTFMALVERADAALYQVKKAGKNNIAHAAPLAVGVKD